MSAVTPSQPVTFNSSPLDEASKLDTEIQLEDAENKAPMDKLTGLEGAMTAELAEQEMSFREAFRDYKAAIGWSLGISLCIIMEGYDTALPVSTVPFSLDVGLTYTQGAFLGLPAYRERYGEYVNEAAGYQLTPAWQAGLGQCSGVAAIISIFVTAWFQQRYGYRVVIQTGLVLMIAAIFVVFFAKNIVRTGPAAVPFSPC